MTDKIHRPTCPTRNVSEQGDGSSYPEDPVCDCSWTLKDFVAAAERLGVRPDDEIAYIDWIDGNEPRVEVLREATDAHPRRVCLW